MQENPVPSIPASKAPKVDGFITDYMKSSSFKSDDAGEICTAEGMGPNAMYVGTAVWQWVAQQSWCYVNP